MTSHTTTTVTALPQLVVQHKSNNKSNSPDVCSVLDMTDGGNGATCVHSSGGGSHARTRGTTDSRGSPPTHPSPPSSSLSLPFATSHATALLTRLAIPQLHSPPTTIATTTTTTTATAAIQATPPHTRATSNSMHSYVSAPPLPSHARPPQQQQQQQPSSMPVTTLTTPTTQQQQQQQRRNSRVVLSSASTSASPLTSAARARESTLTLVRHEHRPSADVSVHRLAPLPRRPPWNAPQLTTAVTTLTTAALSTRAAPPATRTRSTIPVVRTTSQAKVYEKMPRIALHAKSKYAKLSDGDSVVPLRRAHHCASTAGRSSSGGSGSDRDDVDKSSSSCGSHVHRGSHSRRTSSTHRRRCSQSGGDGDVDAPRSVCVYRGTSYSSDTDDDVAAATCAHDAPYATTVVTANNNNDDNDDNGDNNAAAAAATTATEATPPSTAMLIVAVPSAEELQSASDSVGASINTLARSGPAYTRAQMLKKDTLNAFAEIDFAAALHQLRRLDVSGRAFRLARTLFGVVAHCKPYFTCDDLHDLLVLCTPAGASRSEAATFMRELCNSSGSSSSGTNKSDASSSDADGVCNNKTNKGSNSGATSLTFGEFVRHGARLRARLGAADAFAQLPTQLDKLRAIHTRVFCRARRRSDGGGRRKSNGAAHTTRLRVLAVCKDAAARGSDSDNDDNDDTEKNNDSGNDEGDEQSMRVRLLEVARRQVSGALPDGVQPLRVYEHAFLVAYHNAVHRASFVTRDGVPDDLRDYDGTHTPTTTTTTTTMTATLPYNDSAAAAVTTHTPHEVEGAVDGDAQCTNAVAVVATTTTTTGANSTHALPPQTQQHNAHGGHRLQRGSGHRRGDRQRAVRGSARGAHRTTRHTHASLLSSSPRGDGECVGACGRATPLASPATVTAHCGYMSRSRSPSVYGALAMDKAVRARRAQDDALIRRLQCSYGLARP